MMTDDETKAARAGGGNGFQSLPEETVLEEGSTETDQRRHHSATAAATSTGAKRNKKFIGLAVIGLAVVALALGLGLGLTRNNDDDDDDKDSAIAIDNNKENMPPSTTTTTMTTGSVIPIPLITDDVRTLADTYDSCAALIVDLKTAINAQAQTIIEQNVQSYFNENGYFIGYDYYRPYPEEGEGNGVPGTSGSDNSTSTNGTLYDEEPTENLPVSAPTEGGAADSSSAKQVADDSYDTNIQVDGVDEPDMVKSDGVNVWLAYGGDIVKLDADQVTVLSRTTIPVDEADDGDQNPCQQTSIIGLFLIEDKLIVMATNYCPFPMYADVPVASAAESTSVESTSTSTTTSTDGGNATTDAKVAAGSDYASMPIYQASSKTRVLVYDKNTMTQSDSKTFKGDYVTARAIDNVVHMVGTSYLNMYGILYRVDPFDVNVYGQNFTVAEYRIKAKAQIDNNVDAYLNDMLSEIDCTSMQQIVRFQNNETDVPLYDLLGAVTMIHSFDVSGALSASSSKTMIMPSGGMTVYASQQRLVLAVNGYWIGQPMPLRQRLLRLRNINRKIQEDVTGTTVAPPPVTEESYLISYSLSGATATYESYGAVKGYVANPYFMNHRKQNGVDYLYVATSTSGQWTWNEKEMTSVQTVNATSQLFVLNMADMSVVGQANNLGKPGESIFAVRYIGNRAFIVTALQTDPFIAMNLADPANPTVVGELEIPGYSNYLHPVGENYILAVGQDVDATTGMAKGLQISFFDVSNLSNPVRVQNFVESGDYSSSEAQYDFKAFRYLNESQLLILPVYAYDPNTAASTGFDGFRVYNATVGGISSYMSIQHAYEGVYCYQNSGYLQPRSMSFDGNLMTFKAYSILSTDLNTKSAHASPINLNAGVTPTDCGYIMY